MTDVSQTQGNRTPPLFLLALVASGVATVALLTAAAPSNSRPCTHGESSMAVSITDGHVTTIQAPYATGCTS